MTDYDFAPRSVAEDNIFHELLDMIPLGATPDEARERFDWVMSTLPAPPSATARQGTKRILARLLHAIAGRDLFRDALDKGCVDCGN